MFRRRGLPAAEPPADDNVSGDGETTMMRTRGLGTGLLAGLALLAFVEAATAAEGEAKCTILGNLALDAGFVSSANVIPATEDTPAYCRVRATALPAISIEVRLPSEGWNGKLYQVGCGGFCGVLGRADNGNGFGV